MTNSRRKNNLNYHQNNPSYGQPSRPPSTCAPDEVATGGSYIVQEGFGFEPVPSNLINYQVIEPDPGQLANEWEVRIQNSGPNPIEVEALAVCAKLVEVT